MNGNQLVTFMDWAAPPLLNDIAADGRRVVGRPGVAEIIDQLPAERVRELGLDPLQVKVMSPWTRHPRPGSTCDAMVPSSAHSIVEVRGPNRLV